MLFLCLAIVSSAMVSILMRLSEGKIRNNMAMLVMNYGMCTLLAAGYAGWATLTDFGPLLHITAGMGVCNGVLYLVSFLLLQWNVRKNGVVLSSTFMKLGLLVTMVVSVCLYREIPNGLQIIGFLIAVAAIVLMNYRKEERNSTGYKAGLVWLLLCGGMADAMSKIFEESGVPGMGDAFLFFTFFAALGLCFALMLLQGQRPGKWEVLFGLMIGIPNFFSSKFLLRSLQSIPAVIAYPVYSVAGILMVTLAGIVLFRERLEKRQWVALALILGALVLLNS